MTAPITHIKQEKMNMHQANRYEHVEQLVALLTHTYIHLGMREAHAYHSALADFESDYPTEITRLRQALA